MELYNALSTQFSQYILGLDWSFIITFMLLAYLINQQRCTSALVKTLKFRLRKRYRTFLVGLGYLMLLFYIRGQQLSMLESLFKSLLFAMLFHKLLIDRIVNFFFGGLAAFQKAMDPVTDEAISDETE